MLDSCFGNPYYLVSGLQATIHLPCHAGDKTQQTPPLVNKKEKETILYSTALSIDFEAGPGLKF